MAFTASAHYRELVRRKPNSFEPLNNLAWTLATDPDPLVRNGLEAVQLAKRALAVAGSGSPAALDTLAAAYAEAGRFQDAVVTIRKAILSAQTAGQTNAVNRFLTRLAVYQAGKPWRER